jgi:sulfur relay (sulfurtransferase) complex TusBCD TusD component (DsrE family)
MKIAIILQTKEYEKAWNALRFATTARKSGDEVKLFLMGEAVECPDTEHEKFNVAEQFKSYVNAGGIVLSCGTCLKTRNMDGNESCDISTMYDCIDMVKWGDKTLTF